MIDIHSHILPGVDDGAVDWEESIRMCRMAADDGVTTIAATPHMLDGNYNVTRDAILSGVDELRNRLRKREIKLNVVPGADIHVDIRFIDLLRRGELVTINDTGKYVLLEFSPDSLPPNAADFLFTIRTMGTIPIITHPERNYQVQRHPDIVENWVRSGNIIQVTAGSVLGQFGKAAQSCAQKLLKADLIHVLASDAHSSAWRPPVLSKARDVIRDVLGDDEAARMCSERPQWIVDGVEFELPEPKQISRQRKRFWLF